MTHSETLNFIKQLPAYDPPQIFGFHDNANITKELNESNLLCQCLIEIGEIEGVKQSETKESGEQVTSSKKSNEDIVNSILNDLPEKFNLEAIQQNYPLT